jgi:hypothetical protein
VTITLTERQREALARLAAVTSAHRAGRIVLADGRRIGLPADFQVLRSAGFVRVIEAHVQGQGRSRDVTYEITPRGLAYLQSTSDTP